MKPTRNKVLIEVESLPSRMGSLHIPENIRKTQPIAGMIKSINSSNTIMGDSILGTGTRVLVPFYGGIIAGEDNLKIYPVEDILAILGDDVEVGI